MDQKTRNYWLSKKSWTGKEAVYLILDIDPWAETTKQFEKIDRSFYSASDLQIFIENLPEPLRVRYQEVYTLRQRLESVIHEQTSNRIMYNVRPNIYYFNGYQARNAFGQHSELEVSFPVEAYKRFAQEEVLPLNKCGADVPIFGLFYEDQNSQNESDSLIPSTQTENDSDIELIEGITVSEVRSYLDRQSEEFRPRLLALFKLLKAVKGIQKGASKYEKTIGDEISKILQEMGIGNINDCEEFNVTDKDITTLKQIAKKEKLTRGGRPRNS